MNYLISWKDLLYSEKKKKYFLNIISYINEERKNKIIYPSNKNIFKVFALTPIASIKIVIVGQDPYYSNNKAHGLAFSVKKNIFIPLSLRNIFIEIKNDLGDFDIPNHGCLHQWAKQGVFLLNRILTVEENKPGSHANIGWKNFTNKIIDIINIHLTGVIFLLWGNFANEVVKNINTRKHYILQASHPSPLSAYKGFFGCRHFSKSNSILLSEGKKPIVW
ncbi:uracil-DNA glycosylase [Buchnera aphidicola (Kurisakia onigurumii)]|uniref:uracil-DNA glycosylase n=1 Tax=Buchnera aphidicola TaxID=9 RepID=UPI0031B6C4EF